MFSDDDGAFADDDDGVFMDTETVFGDDVPVDSSNPAVTREAEAQRRSPPVQMQNKGSNKAMLKQPVALVAVFDENSQPLVARTVMKEGRPVQLEEYRRPTPDEYNSIMFGGKIVRGGVVGENVPTTTHQSANMQKTPLGGWSKKKKVLVYTLVTVGALGAGYGVYRWRKGRA